jgi:hypothetical protein
MTSLCLIYSLLLQLHEHSVLPLYKPSNRVNIPTFNALLMHSASVNRSPGSRINPLLLSYDARRAKFAVM